MSLTAAQEQGLRSQISDLWTAAENTKAARQNGQLQPIDKAAKNALVLICG